VHALPPAVQHMCVDHRRHNVLMHQQLLHRPDVVAVRHKAAKADGAGSPVHAGQFGPAAVMPSAQGFYRMVVEPVTRIARDHPQR